MTRDVFDRMAFVKSKRGFNDRRRWAVTASLPEIWEAGRYCPTPTIIEAALALYKGHSVEDITRHEADKPDITLTSDAIDDIIRASRASGCKSICFVTGV